MSKKQEFIKWIEKEVKDPSKWLFEDFSLVHKEKNFKISRQELFAEIKTIARDFGEKERTISISYTNDFNITSLDNLRANVINQQEEEMAAKILEPTPF